MLLAVVVAVWVLAIPGGAIAGKLEDGRAAWADGDCPTAREIWRALAEQGNSLAQYNLGMTYEIGGVRCVPMDPDYFSAANWYQKAADQGLAIAEEELGFVFLDGTGRRKDFDAARKWFGKAAAQGDARSKFMIGFMYYHGDGVPQDYVMAANWVRQAAEQGEYQAQSELAAYYERGEGVPQDYVQAYKWIILSIARFRGTDPEREIVIKGRDRIATKMTPVQIAEAQRLAREWWARQTGSLP
jgi:TPR repeat protein